MNILSQNNYNSLPLIRNTRITFGNIQSSKEIAASELVKNKNFFPNITIYDTGIKDSRLKKLIVEKRERMLPRGIVPPDYLYVDEYGINRLKPHLYIKSIIVKPEFLRQGAWRDAVKKIVSLAKENGFEGRVLLDSSPIKWTESYIPNPALAHWANGFRFYSTNDLKQMLEVLNGTRPQKEAPGGTMYYSL